MVALGDDDGGLVGPNIREGVTMGRSVGLFISTTKVGMPMVGVVVGMVVVVGELIIVGGGRVPVLMAGDKVDPTTALNYYHWMEPLLFKVESLLWLELLLWVEMLGHDSQGCSCHC